jgi:hypothetical protein
LSSFTGHAGELVVDPWSSGGGVTLFGDTDGNGSADIAINLAGVSELSVGDFVF